jgi:hypothetical protein
MLVRVRSAMIAPSAWALAAAFLVAGFFALEAMGFRTSLLAIGEIYRIAR